MSFKLRNINKLAINKQMALPLKFKSIKNRENYLVSKCNIEAVKLIENSSFGKIVKKPTLFQEQSFMVLKVQEKHT